MANLKEVRDRIKTVNNTQQITKAMKMVAAAKLRRAQQAIQQMRPYSDKLDAMLRNILSNLEGDAETVFGQERPIEHACVVVVTSNRGLAGAFNTNVIKAAVQVINTKYADVLAKGNLSVLCIGKKGNDFFRKNYKNIHLISDYVDLFSDLSFDNVAYVSQHLMQAFEDGGYDAIDVAYGRFKNAAMQFPEVAQWLPVAKIEATEDDSKLKADYIFEPTKKGLLNYLVPSILQTQFQKFLLDTHASEHGARMTAMDKATENAEELLGDLKLSYNKARQEAITNEILEIVGGAAALENG
ncbi:ATP synthase F1 subunit gamma [Flavilitoribacter nigricans]|uniref:ATP synthase gamma chain n=1 Tax=Flavilitoribacter nigricans (strain ATCC 23147 / DSM 23189 / NBRC 102662 / NCIMB 1420 / SS-2) TaxID=1122177 RepID=A0A2D0N5B8_FLAN2|nr:ATP synthase F1 subunit gamma [Flavilitoribacter nigricans]PHN03576.1 ATP synthase F1 subunit gamma [Flavilitoribacter nigricans DSM 23189 = NBRC 102662]